MTPYWLLFLIFASGALWFSIASASSQTVNGPVHPGPYHGRLLGNRSLFALAAIIPTLMIGLRYDVGTDFGAYIKIFEEIRRRDLGWALRRIDPGYAFLNWIAGQLTDQFWLVNIVCGALFMFGLVRFARVQPNPWLAVAVAVPYLIIGIGMGYSRQAVAIGFSMAGLAAISRGQGFGRFVFWVLIGGLFHRTAIILIPIVAVAYTRNRFQSLLIGIVGCLAGYYLLTRGQGLEHFQNNYVSRVLESQGAGIRLAMNLPPAIIYLAFSKRFVSDSSERGTWRNFSLIAIVSFAAWFFIGSAAALDRMALYVIPLQIFVLARLPTALSGDRPSTLIAIAIVLYSALIQFVWLNFSTNAFHWLPYKAYGFL